MGCGFDCNGNTSTAETCKFSTTKNKSIRYLYSYERFCIFCYYYYSASFIEDSFTSIHKAKIVHKAKWAERTTKFSAVVQIESFRLSIWQTHISKTIKINICSSFPFSNCLHKSSKHIKKSCSLWPKLPRLLVFNCIVMQI